MCLRVDFCVCLRQKIAHLLTRHILVVSALCEECNQPQNFKVAVLIHPNKDLLNCSLQGRIFFHLKLSYHGCLTCRNFLLCMWKKISLSFWIIFVFTDIMYDCTNDLKEYLRKISSVQVWVGEGQLIWHVCVHSLNPETFQLRYISNTCLYGKRANHINYITGQKSKSCWPLYH